MKLFIFCYFHDQIISIPFKLQPNSPAQSDKQSVPSLPYLKIQVGLSLFVRLRRAIWLQNVGNSLHKNTRNKKSTFDLRWALHPYCLHINSEWYELSTSFASVCHNKTFQCQKKKHFTKVWEIVI